MWLCSVQLVVHIYDLEICYRDVLPGPIVVHSRQFGHLPFLALFMYFGAISTRSLFMSTHSSFLLAKAIKSAIGQP